MRRNPGKSPVFKSTLEMSWISHFMCFCENRRAIEQSSTGNVLNEVLPTPDGSVWHAFYKMLFFLQGL